MKPYVGLWILIAVTVFAASEAEGREKRFLGFVKHIWQATKEEVKDLSHQTKDTFKHVKHIAHAVAHEVKKDVKKATKFVHKVEDKAVDGIKKVTHAAVHEVKKDVKKATKFVHKVEDKAVDGIKKVTHAVVHEVKDDFNDVKDFVDDATDAVIDLTIDGIKVVKKVSHKVGEFAHDTVRGVAKFSKSQVNKIKRATIGVYKFASKAFQKTYAVAKKAWNSAKNLLRKIPFDKILDALLHLLVDAITLLTQSACEYFCEISFEAIVEALTAMVGVGSFAAFFACPPLCEAAIAKIKDYIGLDDF